MKATETESRCSEYEAACQRGSEANDVHEVHDRGARGEQGRRRAVPFKTATAMAVAVLGSATKACEPTASTAKVAECRERQVLKAKQKKDFKIFDLKTHDSEFLVACRGKEK